MPTHREKRTLPYSAGQIYDLVADVAKYPEFLPWTAAARIRSRRPLPGGGPRDEVMEADLVISFKLFRERFGSRVVLKPDDMRIETEYLDGPFRYLKSWWQFRDLRAKHASDFEEAGGDATRQLGHSSRAVTTRHYLRKARTVTPLKRRK